MQTVYAPHLPLPSSGEASGLDDAVAAIGAWVRRRFGIDLSPLDTGRGSASDGASLEWSCRFGNAGGLFGLVIDQVNSAAPGFRWRTRVDLGVEGGSSGCERASFSRRHWTEWSLGRATPWADQGSSGMSWTRWTCRSTGGDSESGR